MSDSEAPREGEHVVNGHVRHYMGRAVERAIRRAELHTDVPTNTAEALDVIRRVAELRDTAVHEVYVRGEESRQVCVVMADDPRVAATIAYGYVNHRDELPGSQPSRGSPGQWFTPLTFNEVNDGGQSVGASPTRASCPQCFVTLDSDGTCALCGWES